MDYDQIRTYQQKLNIASLNWESRNLRAEAKKARCSDLRQSLNTHRRGTLREASRIAYLAYACARGVPYARVESTCRDQPSWVQIEKKVKKFHAWLDDDAKKWFAAAREHCELQVTA